jgi:hypothetical protein
MGPDGVHQEPGPAAGGRGGQAVPGAGGVSQGRGVPAECKQASADSELS